MLMEKLYKFDKNPIFKNFTNIKKTLKELWIINANHFMLVVIFSILSGVL